MSCHHVGDEAPDFKPIQYSAYDRNYVLCDNPQAKARPSRTFREERVGLVEAQLPKLNQGTQMIARDDLDRSVVKDCRYAALAVAPTHVLAGLWVVWGSIDRTPIAVHGVPCRDLVRLGKRAPHPHGLGPDCTGHRDRDHGRRVTFFTGSRISCGHGKRKSAPGAAKAVMARQPGR